MALKFWRRTQEEPAVRPSTSDPDDILSMTEEELAAYYEAQGWPPPAKGKDYRVW